MDFTIKNLNRSIADIARSIGYVIIDAEGNGKYNLVRKFSFNNFPRFHAYVYQQGYDFLFSLHLDQKAPIYKGVGVHAHNGEYFGPIIDEEADRIKNTLNAQQ